MTLDRLRLKQRGRRLAEKLGRHPALWIVVGLTVVMRLTLSTQSYWYDEYLSVVTYGIANPNLVEALTRLAENSIHPPLYQFILYVWMSIGGDHEVWTRLLSNLYVAGATVLVYGIAVRFFNQRVALVSAIVFSLLYVPFYYGMETRSYAQTLFFAAASSLALVRLLTRPAPGWGAKALLSDKWFIIGSLANVALLLTHYYNVFFVASQGGIFLMWFLAKRGISPANFVKSTFVGLLPLLIFLIVWGAVLVDSYLRNATRYTVDGIAPERDPLTMLVELVVGQNFLAQPVIGIVLFLIGAAFAVRAGQRLLRGRGQKGDLGKIYLLLSVLLPVMLAYALFTLSGHERYSPRYFIFCAPALALLVTVAAFDASAALARRSRQLRRLTPLAPVLIALFVAIAAVPEAFKAGTDRKHDHRGWARQVAELAAGSAQMRYIVFDVSRRALLQYYLERTDAPISVAAQITRTQENNERFFSEGQMAEIAQYDFVVIVYTHDRRPSFPNLDAFMSENFTLEHSLQDHMGRGVLIYRVPEPAGA